MIQRCFVFTKKNKIITTPHQEIQGICQPLAPFNPVSPLLRGTTKKRSMRKFAEMVGGHIQTAERAGQNPSKKPRRSRVRGVVRPHASKSRPSRSQSSSQKVSTSARYEATRFEFAWTKILNFCAETLVTTSRMD